MGEETYRKQKHSVASRFTGWLKRRSLKQIVLSIVLLVFVIWVAERLINVGTFFGYQVTDNKTKTAAVDDGQVETLACSKLTNDEVSDVLGAKAKRIGGAFPDKTEPNLISTCSYMLNLQPARNITVLIRDSTTDNAAISVMNDVKNRNEVEELEGYGDEAFFSPVARQLNVREGKRITTVTVSKPVAGSKKSNKDATIELFKKI